MPLFFTRLMWLAGLASGTAITIHEVFEHYGIQPHEWWTNMEQYLIGGGAGVMFACKFTQKYSGKPIERSQQHKTDDTCQEDETETN